MTNDIVWLVTMSRMTELLDRRISRSPLLRPAVRPSEVSHVMVLTPARAQARSAAVRPVPT